LKAGEWHVLRVIAPAKVNLFLGIGPVRSDGYHEVVSVFHALSLADEIFMEPAERLVFECSTDLGVPAEQNLAHRAACALGEALRREPSVHIRIKKRIPHGAGLGGGSSDAAAVIAGLAQLWGLDTKDPRCRAVAASLGADVPFFLTGGAALMSGRGDELVRDLPALVGTPAVLVRPPRPVSTAAAYRMFDLAPVAPGDPRAVIEALEAGDAEALATAVHNNMEAASFSVEPLVAEAVGWTRQSPGVRGAIVAGSGSAVFGLCEDRAAAELVASQALAHGWWSEPIELVAHGATVVSEG
jgi:4-diphosphocytidyl-2-C-methyl-D-erythritol kinase